jgi:phospholipase/carboxylesterase
VAGLFKRLRPALSDKPSSHLVVLLHGLGSDESDMLGAAASLDAKYAVCAFRAPFDYDYGGYAWFALGIGPEGVSYDAEQAVQSVELLSREVAGVAEEQGIPENKTVIGGFSQGAMMTAGLLLAHPRRFAGGLLMSGAVLPEFLEAFDEPGGSTPILIQHGTQDPVVPVSSGRAASEALLERGFHVDFRRYAMGHSLSLESLADIKTWLEVQSSK